MLKKILEEDDCAPDARAYFMQKFLEITGIPVHTFKFKAKHTSTQTSTIWRLGEFVLEYDCTDPVLRLLREENYDGGKEEKHSDTAATATSL